MIELFSASVTSSSVHPYPETTRALIDFLLAHTRF